MATTLSLAVQLFDAGEKRKRYYSDETSLGDMSTEMSNHLKRGAFDMVFNKLAGMIKASCLGMKFVKKGQLSLTQLIQMISKCHREEETGRVGFYLDQSQEVPRKFLGINSDEGIWRFEQAIYNLNAIGKGSMIASNTPMDRFWDFFITRVPFRKKETLPEKDF